MLCTNETIAVIIFSAAIAYLRKIIGNLSVFSKAAGDIML